MRTLLKIYRDAFSGLTRELWILGIGALINRCGTMVLPFMSIYLTAEEGLGVAEAGRLVAAYGVGGVCGGYLGGWLADHIGAIRAQQTSLVSGGIGFLVLISIHEPLVLAAALFVVGTLVEAFRPAVMTAVAERAPAGLEPKAFAFLRLAANLGIGIGASVGGALALYGFSWLFIADAVTCFATALLLVGVAERRTTPSSGADNQAGGATSPFRDVPFLGLLVLVVALVTALFQLFTTFPLYLRQDVGLEENVIGLLLSFNALLIVAFEMVLIHLVSARDRMHVIGLGGFLICAGFALMPYHDGTWYLAFTVAVWTVGEMLALPMLNVVVAERAGAGTRGRYMGLYTMAFSTAFILAPITGTYVYERFGPLELWHTMGFVGIGLWLGAVLLRPAAKD